MYGFYWSKIWTKVLGRADINLVMVGLEGSGKSTLLQAVMNASISTLPMPGLSLESMRYKGLNLEAWDTGRSQQPNIINPGKDQALSGLNNDRVLTGLIYVVDSCDRDRIELVAEDLKKVATVEPFTNTPLLVMANKQDLPDALSLSEMTDKLLLVDLKGKQWFVQGVSATTGHGIKEGLDLLGGAFLRIK